MNFDLSEEQIMLADTLSGFLDTRYRFAARRQIVGSEPGWSSAIWSSFADELGILGALVPERAGGLGGGPVEAMVLMEAAGRALLVEPLRETALVAVDLLIRVSGERVDTLLTEIVEGRAIVAFAHVEPTGRHDFLSVATSAELTDAGWRLTGIKAMVSAAPWATHLILTARIDGDTAIDPVGIGLFLVEVGSDQRLRLDTYHTIDDRRAADIVLDGLVVAENALLGPRDAYDTIIAPARDAANAALCAEAIGVLRVLLEQTLDYVKQRRQFGRSIGQFQVIQHRLVDMTIAVESATSLSYMATLMLDALPVERARAAAAASTGVARALRLVAQQAVQLHGGIGMTDELALSHYFRRATAIEIELGSQRMQLARFRALAA